MPLLIMCENAGCGELFDVPDEAAGQSVRCPACGHVQRAGSTAPESESQTLPPALENPAPESTNTDTAETEPAGEPEEESPALLELHCDAAQEADGQSSRDRITQEVTLLETGDVQTGSPSSSPATPTQADDESAEEELELEEPDSARSSRAQADVAEGSQAGLMEESAKEEVTGPDEDEDWVVEGVAMQAEARPHHGATADDGILEHRGTTVFVICFGVVGLLLGPVVGGLVFRDALPWSLHIGGAVGWAGGFVLAFLLVLAMDTQSIMTIRCSACGCRVSQDAESCPSCGASLLETTFRPQTAQSLRSGRFAQSRPGSLFWLILLAVVGVMFIGGVSYPVRRGDVTGVSALGVWIACGLVGWAIAAYWLRFMIRVIDATLSRGNVLPGAPWLLTPEVVRSSLVGVLLGLLYGVSILGLPLLPQALLWAAVPGKKGWWDPARLIRSAWWSVRDFAVLWLFVLFWLGGAVLGCAVCWLGIKTVGRWIPPLEGASGVAVSVLCWAGAALPASVGLAVISSAIARCVGLYGLHSETALKG